MRLRAVLNPFLATAPMLQLVPRVMLPDAGAPSGWGSAHTLLHCLGISPLLCPYTTAHTATHHPLHHVHTPSSMQAHCTHTCSINHSLILTFKPLLFSAHSCVSTPGKAALWGAAEGRTWSLQESSPSSESGWKDYSVLPSQQCFLMHTT